ncbi:uncharacterized protein LOC124643091 isoform X2 [Helicoverpa zea]|nr:uncharacterized protein LOC124643091 isoform X2 [Helicoverpa zea]
MNELEEYGLDTSLAPNESKIKVKLRAFICDSPARALIKGVTNFNGKHGCLKCTVIGEYSHKSNTVTFPKSNCPKRNDKDFRAKKYEEHHKHDSPLLKLNIDMIEDFPVADSLHLIDLGLMKRLLIGWRDGKLGKYLTKWSAREIDIVNSFLLNCQMPKEIHRSMRSVDVLAHWKGSEYRSFFYYLSVIILNHVLKPEPFYHFLNLFCAITICSNEKHLPLLPIAEKMLEDFTESFKAFYGRDYITSNIHNLTHIVDEVRKFGILQTFNAYPFENKLYAIKQTIRHGKQPLQQVARRIIERQLIETEHLSEEIVHYPYIKKNQRNGLLVLHLETNILSSKDEDKWFLTDKNHVIELKSISLKDNTKLEIEITGYRIVNILDAFEKPLKSSFLNIYKCDCAPIEKSEVLCKVQNIKCKLVSITYNSEIFFLPLLHTL